MVEQELAGVQHRFVQLPGLRMHLAEAGAGEPVLLLHGFPQHWWEWRQVLPPLADTYRVICPDLRGAGMTDAPSSGYDRRRLLADVIALLDALGLDSVHVTSHDWGALVAFQLCLRHPARVRTHLSLATPPPFVSVDPRFMAGAWRLWFQPVIMTPGLGPALLASGSQRLARHLLTHGSADPAIWSEHDVERFVAPLREPARARAASLLYRHFILPEAVRMLTGHYRGTRLVTPTRVLYGAEDPIVRPELLSGYEDADDLTVDRVDGAAHFIADEQPAVVVRHALELFSRSARDPVVP
jgi:pimeloyl-ACP methyl ester carboxylesterase